MAVSTHLHKLVVGHAGAPQCLHVGIKAWQLSLVQLILLRTQMHHHRLGKHG